MKHIQAAVAAYLEQESGVRAVEEGSRCREYPLLAVTVREDGTTLLDGGRQAEHRYAVTVTAASDRDREHATELLAALVPPLLRGIPARLPDAEGTQRRRVLHPLGIAAEEDKLTFDLSLCQPLPKVQTESEPAGFMERLHLVSPPVLGVGNP